MLEGLTILHCGDTPAALMAAGLFSDLGAQVLLLEGADGHPLRSQPTFQVWARGTESLVAEDPAARAAELAPRFDVLIGDDAQLRAAGNPRARRVTAVIDSALPAWAPWTQQTAPSAAAASSLAESFGGFLHTQQGYRDGPFYLVDPAASYGCALLAGIGVLASLCAAVDRGAETVRASHLAGTLGMLYFSSVARPGEEISGLPTDGDAKRITTPLIRFYEASDGWLVLGAVSVSLWAKICIALGAPDLLADPRFAGAPFAIPEAEWRLALTTIIAAKIKQQTVAEWLSIFRSNGVVSGPLLEPGAAFDVPQVAAIGMRWTAEIPEVGEIIAPGVPIQFPPERELPPPRRAPLLGEHDTAWLPDRSANTPRPVPAGGEPVLSGVRVLDFGTLAACPGIGRMLAGLGADVIKVETPEGDPFRGLGYSFASVNRGKRAVVANLSSQEIRPHVERLIASADIVIHNFRASLRERLHLRPADLLALNDDVVECAVTGYGQGGPDAHLPSIDVVFESLTGAPLLQGGGSEPVGYSSGPSDNGTTLMGTFATLAALYEHRHGAGGAQRVGVSLLGTSLYRHVAALVTPLSRWRELSLGPDPVGPTAAHRLYRCADGWILLAVDGAQQWRAFTAFADGLPSAYTPADPAWEARVAGVLESALAIKPASDVLRWCAEHQVPVADAQNFATFAGRSLAHGSALVNTFQHPTWGPLIGLNELIDFEGSSWADVAPPPEIGSTDLRTAEWRSTGAAGAPSGR